MLESEFKRELFQKLRVVVEMSPKGSRRPIDDLY